MTNAITALPVWSGYVLAALVGALASLWISRKGKKTKELIADCRLAVHELQRFRKLEDFYASEMARLKGGKATKASVRLEMRKELKPDQIGEYGQPNRIRDLLRRLGVQDVGA